MLLVASGHLAKKINNLLHLSSLFLTPSPFFIFVRLLLIRLQIGAECMTIQRNLSNVTYLDGMTNYGFQSPDMDVALFSGVDLGKSYFTGPMTNVGPYDQGAAFDFSFHDTILSPRQSHHLSYVVWCGAEPCRGRNRHRSRPPGRIRLCETVQ